MINRSNKPRFLSFPFLGQNFPHKSPLPHHHGSFRQTFFAQKKTMGGGNGWCISSSQSWMLCSEKVFRGL
jgi:hypothetical protein